MASLNDLDIDLTVMLGQTRMPVHMLLRMGRGAIVTLDASENDMVEIHANNHPVARGHIIVTGTRIRVEVTELIRKPDIIAQSGVSIGSSLIAAEAAAESPSSLPL